MRSWVIGLAAALWVGGVVRAGDYQYVEMKIPGASVVQVGNLNNDGVAVGSYQSGGRWHGFVWSWDGAGGVFQGPFDYGTQGDTFFRGVNNLGYIVGDYGSGQSRTGLVRSPDGSYKAMAGAELGAGLANPGLYGINDQLRVIGIGGNAPGTHPFLVNADGTNVKVADGQYTNVIGTPTLNNAGQAVFECYDGGRGYVYLSGPEFGSVKSLGYGIDNMLDMPGQINNLGQIAGYVEFGMGGYVSNPDGTGEGPLYFPDGYNGSQTQITGINDRGWMVGQTDGGVGFFVRPVGVPEPSGAVAVLGVVGGMMGRRRGR